MQAAGSTEGDAVEGRSGGRGEGGRRGTNVGGEGRYGERGSETLSHQEARRGRFKRRDGERKKYVLQACARFSGFPRERGI